MYFIVDLVAPLNYYCYLNKVSSVFKSIMWWSRRTPHTGDVAQVVTAAHCVVSSPLIDWLFPLDAVVAGTHDVVRFDPYAQVSDIDQKIIHPSFNWYVCPASFTYVLPTDFCQIDCIIFSCTSWNLKYTEVEPSYQCKHIRFVVLLNIGLLLTAHYIIVLY